ncbi:hypothetical protein F3Y22_tig00110388pilonHSYRG00254 [Hibiscus syriacus]|uniref:HTH myb-type domain-containing protein n=1 Tax=Hibiscus syriacus TaxID=106335 RepID=A0A6A3AUL4_HIBSY|nr:hypothetical protein F3Y22_tig00110388pilonHSYRG00254 [Hibiscus syriacus]
MVDLLVVRKNTPTKVHGQGKKTNASLNYIKLMVKAVGDLSPKLLVCFGVEELWSLIAARLREETDNEIKNYWNTHIKRKLYSRGIDPQTHSPLVVMPLMQVPANIDNGGADSAEDSNGSSSSGLSREEVFPQINLELSIGLPFPFQQSRVSSHVDLNQSQQQQQRVS